MPASSILESLFPVPPVQQRMVPQWFQNILFRDNVDYSHVSGSFLEKGYIGYLLFNLSLFWSLMCMAIYLSMHLLNIWVIKSSAFGANDFVYYYVFNYTSIMSKSLFAGVFSYCFIAWLVRSPTNFIKLNYDAFVEYTKNRGAKFNRGRYILLNFILLIGLCVTVVNVHMYFQRAMDTFHLRESLYYLVFFSIVSPVLMSMFMVVIFLLATNLVTFLFIRK